MQISTPQYRSTSIKTEWTATDSPQCICSHKPELDVFEPSQIGLCNLDPIQEQRRTELGQSLWASYMDGKLDLLPVQVSGRNDGADARANIVDTAMGKQAKRSSYETAPGGRVSLSFSLLEGMKDLLEDFDFRVTALAGGSHSSRSRHYLGVGIDVDKIDGRQVDKNHPRFLEFMDRARAMGATEVLGPGARGHDGHIHIAWPRDARVSH